MKVTRLFLILVLTMIFAACSKDESNDVVDTNISTISAEWIVTEFDEGDGWTPIDSSRIILSEDGFFMLMGQIYFKMEIYPGRYSFSNNTALLREDNGNHTLSLQFKEVRQRTATAVTTFVNGKQSELRMHRDESHPLYYKEPTAFLRGRWNMVASKPYGDLKSNYEPCNDGYAVFDGNKVTLQIGSDTYQSSFHRFNIEGFVLDSEAFSFSKGERSDEITVYRRPERVMVFRRE